MHSIGKGQQISIVIPTILRNSIFKTISSILNQENGNKVLIEVVVNPISKNVKLLKKLQNDNRISVRTHLQAFSTAEESALHAAYSSKSDWIWILGDDDIATEGSISHVIGLVSNLETDFWLLNCNLNFQGVPLKYYDVGPKTIQISRSFDLWRKLGFLTATTTLSCFLIKREALDLNIFQEFNEIQGIYSHSFSLLAMLRDSLVGITNYACVDRNEQGANEIGASLLRYAEMNGRSFDSLWIEGVIALAEKLSEITRIPFDELMSYREIEVIKEANNSYVKQSDLKFLVSSTREVALQRLSQRPDQSPLLSRKLGVSNQGLVLSGPIRISI
jgi:glycosyltransferase involved in cell wall biosynthesis